MQFGSYAMMFKYNFCKNGRYLNYSFHLILITLYFRIYKHFEYKKMDNDRKSYFLRLLTSICGAVIAPSLFFYGLSNSYASDSSMVIYDILY